VKHDAVLGPTCEGPVDDDDVEVHVQVAAPAEALHEVDGAALSADHTGALGPSTVAREDRIDRDAGERGEDVRPECRELTKLEGEREHVLPHGHVGQHAIDDGGGRTRHSPASAARARRARLAGERHQEVVAAGVAVCAGETPSRRRRSRGKRGADISARRTPAPLAGAPPLHIATVRVFD
jgi:hypothetical protein